LRRLLRRLLGRGVAPQDAHGVRWVVIDCEASGLDPARERLLELGAVAVRAGRIEPADSFHARLRQEAPSAADNILVHGIGADAQRAGRPAPEALRSFAHYLGAGLPVAFHAEFDAALLGRALGAHGLEIAAPWLDLAQLAPALYPERARASRSLDEWLESCGIAAPGRHGALEDAFSTAQLLLVLLAEAARQRADTVAELRHIARGARWLAPR
jgi:DNA polymerase-3 subunit epsilon